MGPDGKPIDFGGQGSALSSQIPSSQISGVGTSSSMPSSYPTASSSQQYLYYDNSQSQSQGQYYAYSYQGYGQAYGYDTSQAQYYPYQGQGQAYYYDGNAQQYNHYPAQIQQYDSSGHYVAQASQQQYYADTSGSSVAGSDYGAPVNYGSYARESNVNEGNIIGSLQGQMQAYNNYAGPAPHIEPTPQPYQAPPPPQDVQPYIAYQAPQVAPQQAPPPPPPQPQAPQPPQPRVQIPIVPAFNKLAGNNANMGKAPQGGSGTPTDSSGKTNAQNKALQEQMDINRRAAAEAEQLAKEEEEKRRRKEKEDKDRK
jgi:hypothetical protein